jgi:hypothetical protein
VQCIVTATTRDNEHRKKEREQGSNYKAIDSGSIANHGNERSKVVPEDAGTSSSTGGAQQIQVWQLIEMDRATTGVCWSFSDSGTH